MAERLKSDGGMSLAEMLVSVVILGVVSMLLAGTFISLQRTVSASSQRFDDLGQARIALDASSKTLRTVTRLRSSESPFTIATPNEVQFFASLRVAAADDDENERLQRVHLQLVGGEFIETITRGEVVLEPHPTDPELKIRVWQETSAPVQRVIARGVLTDEPLFTYFAPSNDPDNPNPTVLAMETDGTLSAENQRRVRHVGIRVAIQSTAALGAPPTVVANRIHLPNQMFMQQQEAS